MTSPVPPPVRPAPADSPYAAGGPWYHATVRFGAERAATGTWRSLVTAEAAYVRDVGAYGGRSGTVVVLEAESGGVLRLLRAWTAEAGELPVPGIG
ncbi:hypothetical protein [Streptomyces clavuligerus]|uniref:hypothetical protein n=1 Tax=Streptomyces clavuligerus TaxID=1901 RepID=UPI00017FF5E2|nr:hypothetical protein [Streptomyces clavuligerus]EDY49211.1 hypothetical protein SSCG_02239 [Streptomyces clavuligerus]WDN56125.1 hypothetical protein LL058_30155 [Streptomyces clavuligerus]